MDPTSRDPEHFTGEPGTSGDSASRKRPPRDPLATEPAPPTGAQARVVQVISGDLLLTVNPVDGTEAEQLPPGERAPAPVRRTAEERADHERAGSPPVPPGPPAPQLPLLERQEEREQLVRLLSRGRSVRLTGPAGSGRTALLEAVAADCADLAPDGVVRLNGHRRTVTDLLHALFSTVHRAPLYRPDREELLALLGGVGAVVVVDDLECGGAALDELLDATPECAFLFSATPDLDTGDVVEEVFLGGLSRAAATDLLAQVVGRPLSEDESNWAGDLWFESEGLPLRFVQAGALLSQRDRLTEEHADPDEYNAFEERPAGPPPVSLLPASGTHPGDDTPLPSIGEGAAPSLLLASRLSEAARDTLRFAVALGGEVPHQAHLPALVGHTHADAALGELAGCGLLSPAGSRYRLAAGVLAQLEAGGYGDDAVERARTAAQHYAWWAGHPSVTVERAAAESDAVLASMARLVPGSEAGQAGTVVLLARRAAPAFAAALHWGAWEKVLRIGQEAARIAGEVAEEAYFHHELGVLALCGGHLDRARAELETSIGMRGALADKSGAVTGRRALALVSDRAGTPAAGSAALAAGGAPTGRPEPVAPAPLGLTAPTAVLPTPRDAVVVDAVPLAPAAQSAGPAARLWGGVRNNLVAVGAGALLVAVLGTVVTLGATSGSEEADGRDATPGQSVTEDGGDDGGPSPEDTPQDDGVPGETAPSGSASASPGPSGSATTPTGTPSPGATASPSRTSPADGGEQDGNEGGDGDGDGNEDPTGGNTGTDGSTPPESESSGPATPTPTTSTSPAPTPTIPTPTDTGTTGGEEESASASASQSLADPTATAPIV
ncbi:ATP-binding protein [uncultured Streptomyces sp.]|uniref:ATP-binding protein n=1 Tax=uncultured Streptomyces sp. TaxID=174707 RepID=UPI00261DE4BF|nr:ATP-binding protein [uncultured Streptomyces sp.]